jgi:predicted Rdx family selenoprotein
MADILTDKDLVSQIESFALIPSDKGRFEFNVNGGLIFSKTKLGRHAEEGEVMGLLKKHLAEAS